jgi:mannose-6-phosphate isomerase-like protein (cupin superfamily)
MTSSERVLVVDLNDNPENQKLLEGQPQTCGMRSGRVYLKTGKSCGRHSTKEHEELLVFLSGRGQLLVGEAESFHIGIGKICYIPQNTFHDVQNNGTEPLIYIYCVVPVVIEKSRLK